MSRRAAEAAARASRHSLHPPEESGEVGSGGVRPQPVTAQLIDSWLKTLLAEGCHGMGRTL